MDYTLEIRDLYLMEQIYSTFFSTTNKLQNTGDRYLVEITARQYMLLLAIAHLPEGETTLVNIARKLETSKQSANKLLNNLIGKGYVVTVPSKQDKRSINAVITDDGIQVMTECGIKVIDYMTDVFAEFTSSELEVLWSLIQKLHRFDGQEPDGFEENVNSQFEKMPGFQQAQKQAIEKYALRRRDLPQNPASESLKKDGKQ